MLIRKGVKDDLPQVLELIKELAIFEKAPLEVENTVQKMEEDGFGKNAVFEFFVAEEDSRLVGLALYYYCYSTWKGKCIFLEDIIVTEEFRGRGIGRKLFHQVISKAREEKVARLNWQVLDWNEPAIEFYKKLDAQFLDEWLNCRLDRAQLNSF